MKGASVDMKSNWCLKASSNFYERHQHHDLTIKTKTHYKWKWCVINIFMEMFCWLSSVCAMYCLELVEMYPFVFPTCFLFPTLSSLLKTVKCKGYCPSGYNHHVSSESAWVGESLGCMCLMTAGSEVEWRQWFQEWGCDEEERWWDYSLY